MNATKTNPQDVLPQVNFIGVDSIHQPVSNPHCLSARVSPKERSKQLMRQCSGAGSEGLISTVVRDLALGLLAGTLSS